MMVLWVTLLLLHQGHSLVPVTRVQLGEPVTFTCANKELNTKEVHWYRQSAGDTMKLILTFWQTKIEHGPEFSESRMKANLDNSFSNLTILRTIGDDEGMYHCGVAEWIKTEWSGTYLLVKGNSQRTSNYTVVQWSTPSDPVRPGDSVTLQCSLLSDSENKKCPGDHSVYWFRVGSEKSHPEIIHTDGNHQCEKRSDTVKSCVYGFSKTISSSDAGTYYCAVATCGQIVFGNGTKLDIDGISTLSHTARVIISLLCVVLALTLIVIVVLICAIKNNDCDCCSAAVALNTNCGGQNTQQRKMDIRIYSAVVFSMKTDRGGIRDGKAAERAKIYTAVKAFGVE
ncbi:signal-regulatory protein beta-2-like [Channa argus]|uniref:signal-regulatory protein beta-2-like n=1 Tax=Channa argus TaxID=215402 RepID=UPI00352183F3